MSYWIAGIDVHKRMLAVVVADVELEGEYQFERRTVGTSPDQLRGLADWLADHEVEEVVMESTAQYWRPAWEALERYWKPRHRARERATPMSGTFSSATCKVVAAKVGTLVSYSSLKAMDEARLSACNSVAVARMAPHPSAAVLMYDFMLSDAQKILADRDYVATSRKVGSPLDRDRLTVMDSALALAQADKWSPLYQQIISSRP